LAKTLVAWVSLNDLDDPTAGSVLTLENPTGADVFDGIIYAERTPRQWMAGSNGFQRTPDADNGGDEESVTEPGEVMVAITYAEDGTITIYREGEPYAEYVTGSPPMYLGGVADVLIGPRHDDRIAAGGPMHFFDGHINEARIYNKVLTLEEIAAVFAMGVGANGDFDGNGAYELTDIDMLTAHVIAGTGGGAFDLDDNSAVENEDRRIWVEEVKNTWFGDANLDLEFNSGDMVGVFVRGKYETGEDASWEDGDWNGDGTFGSGDMVTAFVGGGYEKGKRPAVANVPEPSTVILLALGWMAAAWYRREVGGVR
jgi:hypothetical protein